MAVLATMTFSLYEAMSIALHDKSQTQDLNLFKCSTLSEGAHLAIPLGFVLL